MGDLAVRAHRQELRGDIQKGLIPGVASTILTSTGSRSTEKTALKRLGRVPRLTAFHKRMIKLEQIALNPKTHLEMRVKNRPMRAIWQPQARAMWIASQPGIKMNTVEVRMCLEDCERVVSTAIRAGYDPSILD